MQPVPVANAQRVPATDTDRPYMGVSMFVRIRSGFERGDRVVALGRGRHTDDRISSTIAG
jgi:hypothetical protein